MSYRRVLPRDLFNEANLLKCWGQLWLLLEGSAAEIAPECTDQPFEVEQNDGDGSIFLRNVQLKVRGHRVPIYRPLNSRAQWPLRALAPEGEEDADEVEVFTEHGTLSADFLKMIGNA